MAFATNRNGALWLEGRMPYVISDDFSDDQKAVVEDAIEHWNSRTIMRIVPKTATDVDYVSFEPADDSCTSFPGRVGGEQAIGCDIGDGFNVGSVIHEIGHAVGYYHEHQRPDRDLFITVDETNIEEDFKFAYEIRTGQILTDYDYGSIMHYRRTGSFAIDEGEDVITPLDPNASIGQRDGLSALDKLGVCVLYGAPHYTVAWQDDQDNDGESDIWMAGLTRWGKYCGGQQRRLHSTAGDQRDPTIGLDGDRNAIVAWEHRSGGVTHISLRAFTPDMKQHFGGSRASSPTSTNNRSPDIAVRPSGEFVLAWQEVREDGMRIKTRGYTATGLTRFPLQTIAAPDTGIPARPVVGIAGNGNFIVVWAELIEPESLTVRGRRFDADGIGISSEFIVAEHLGDQDVIPRLVVASDGAFYVAWENRFRDVFVRGFNADATERFATRNVSSDPRGDQNFCDLALTAAGQLAVVWTDDRNQNHLGQIRGRVFHSDGSQAVADFTVNPRGGGDQRQPRIGTWIEGGYVVTWADDEQKDGKYQVHAQVFDAAHQPTSYDRQTVNQIWKGTQRNPAIGT